MRRVFTAMTPIPPAVYGCAATIVERFADSTDASIAASAQLLTLAYRSLILGDQAVVKEVVSLLDQSSKDRGCGCACQPARCG